LNQGKQSTRAVIVPSELQEEWFRVESLVRPFFAVPRFLIFSSRQIARLDRNLSGQDLPGIVLSALCENIRRSGTYQAALYQAARNLYPHYFAGQKELRIRHMVRWFTPMEIVSILLLIYFHRYLAMRCPEGTWEPVSRWLRHDMALGRRLGACWEELTPGQGLLVAGMRRIAQGFLILVNRKSDVPTKLLNAGLGGDGYLEREKELSFCGISHLMIAAYLSQQCGFGVPLTATFAAEKASPQDQRSDDEYWRATRLVLEEVKSGSSLSDITMKGEFHEKEEIQTFEEYQKRIQQDEGVFPWVNAQKEDVKKIVDHSIVDIA
jgi:hypothetical protein